MSKALAILDRSKISTTVGIPFKEMIVSVCSVAAGSCESFAFHQGAHSHVLAWI